MACELYQQEVGGLAIKSEHGQQRYNEKISDLPPCVMGWLGLVESEGYIAERNSSLAHENDEGATFDEIADIIESEPEGLFC